MVDINWNPSRRDLNVFAGLLVPFAGLVGWMWYRRTGDVMLPLALLAVTASVVLVGLLVPRVLRGLYVAWMVAAFPIGWVLSHLVLGAVFYLAVTPWGLFMRLCGRDPLQRKFDKNATTYWVPRAGSRPVASYFQQF